MRWPGAGWLDALVVAALTAACGTPPDLPASNAGIPELTFVGLTQYSTPVPLPDGSASNHRVTVDVVLGFRSADAPSTVVLDIESPASGRTTHNELSLVSLNPDIVNASEGRWEMRAPVIVPDLGGLRFRSTLQDQRGTSQAVEGDFTVQASLNASNTTQTTQVDTLTGVVVP